MQLESSYMFTCASPSFAYTKLEEKRLGGGTNMKRRIALSQIDISCFPKVSNVQFSNN